MHAIKRKMHDDSTTEWKRSVKLEELHYIEEEEDKVN
jgi:hypothetical protein